MTTNILCTIWLENEVRKQITHTDTDTHRHTDTYTDTHTLTSHKHTYAYAVYTHKVHIIQPSKHQTINHKATEQNIQTKTVGGLTIGQQYTQL